MISGGILLPSALTAKRNETCCQEVIDDGVDRARALLGQDAGLLGLPHRLVGVVDVLALVHLLGHVLLEEIVVMRVHGRIILYSALLGELLGRAQGHLGMALEKAAPPVLAGHFTRPHSFRPCSMLRYHSGVFRIAVDSWEQGLHGEVRNTRIGDCNVSKHLKMEKWRLVETDTIIPATTLIIQ